MEKRVTFTPLFESLPDGVDMYTAAILGFVWRHEQLSLKKCFTALTTMAQATYMSERTAMRKLKYLIQEGWITDLTPNKRNAPHEYKTTKKFRSFLRSGSQFHTLTDSHNNDSNSRLALTESLSIQTDRQSELPQSQSQSAAESLEETKKRQIKKINEDNSSEKNAQNILERIKEIIKPEIPIPFFDQYISNLNAIGIDDKNLIIETDSKFNQALLQDRAFTTMNNYLKGLLPNQKIKVMFVLPDSNGTMEENNV